MWLHRLSVAYNVRLEQRLEICFSWRHIVCHGGLPVKTCFELIKVPPQKNSFVENCTRATRNGYWPCLISDPPMINPVVNVNVPQLPSKKVSNANSPVIVSLKPQLAVTLSDTSWVFMYMNLWSMQTFDSRKTTSKASIFSKSIPFRNSIWFLSRK